ncbi:MAG: hypothetical protein KJ044_09335 [Planctomycetes bacterium]|nr:hypothetical protein [Planctomycetota bacterium]
MDIAQIIVGAQLFAAAAPVEHPEREHPDSSLADDAARAAGYWRRRRADLFGARVSLPD